MDPSPSPTGESATVIVDQEKFLGQKERRRSSAAKKFLGDYLNLTCEPAVQKILAKYGDYSISFADIVVKVNKRNKMQERILVLTEKAIYNITPAGYKMKRRIGYEQIGDIKLSKFSDNFFCVHVPSEYDYMMESSKKTEIISRLAESYERFMKKQLTVIFSNSFVYTIDKDVYREIQFEALEGGIRTLIFSKKKAK